ncbi:MAG: hypothetical protein ACC682_00810 [Gemmatimonadota bacterium]
MTYEDRMRHRDLVERSAALVEQLGEGDEWASVTRGEARELAALIQELIGELSPERWDHVMEAVVNEAARRAGSLQPASQ